jgi:hypothetical protein
VLSSHGPPPRPAGAGRVGRGRGESLDLGGEGRQGPEGRAADGEEAGEAAQDVVVGGRREAAARAVEGRDVEAALVRVQEAAAPVQAAGLGPAEGKRGRAASSGAVCVAKWR